ncbi:hypothetical protein Tco_1288174 [Tanacetum coccineum]
MVCLAKVTVAETGDGAGLYVLGTEHEFLSQKGIGGGRVVKEKNQVLVNDAAKGSANDANVTMVHKVVSNDVNTHNVNSETPLESNKGADVNSNANVKPTVSASLPASVSFATLLKGDTSWKSMNFRTLVTPAGNGADVVVPLESIQAISE